MLVIHSGKKSLIPFPHRWVIDMRIVFDMGLGWESWDIYPGYFIGFLECGVVGQCECIN